MKHLYISKIDNQIESLKLDKEVLLKKLTEANGINEIVSVGGSVNNINGKIEGLMSAKLIVLETYNQLDEIAE